MMLLSSVAPHTDATRAAELGVSASLVKPVRQAVLKDAVLAAIGRPLTRPESVHRQQSPEPVKPPPADRRLRVLLAEDNLVNQRLFNAILGKAGHHVTTVGDGSAAVSTATSQPFDIVLMDLQMPGMGGLEATRLIRNTEAATGQHLPIVALTAHALKGDRERCLDAGMDGYLSKPVQSAQLLATLRELTQNGPAAAAPPDDDPPLVNEAEVLSRVDGDRHLLGELTRIFVEQSRQLLAELNEAIETGNAAEIERTAHTIRGSIGNFGAPAASETAVGLELAARSGRLAETGALAAQLSAQVATIERVLIEVGRRRES
jgi:CheY-like chemotaxis protein/HPt (histidine-containing phosphotransfer) domain-containing protein